MRLFTGLGIPVDIRARAAAIADQLKPLAKLKWSPPEKLHITTKFIGEWPEVRLAELQSTLATVDGAPFPVTIRGLDWMNDRVLIAKVEASEPLTDLAEAISAALATIGVKEDERGYHPHVTLARGKHRKDVLALEPAVARFAPADFGTFPAMSFTLYLSRSGKYLPLKEYSLIK